MRVSPIVKEIKLLRKEVHASSEKLAEIQEKGFEKLIEKDSEDKKVKKDWKFVEPITESTRYPLAKMNLKKLDII